MPTLSLPRVKALLARAARTRMLVVGDVMLDQYLWGRVSRISPEAPVPVLEFERESFVPGGAANVGRNLTSLGAAVELYSVVGRDGAARRLKGLLHEQNVGSSGLLFHSRRPTSIKTRVIAHQQQVVRVDRETRTDLDAKTTAGLLSAIRHDLGQASAIIVGDYGKGVVTQRLLEALKADCRQRGLWLSLDPKPIHHLGLKGLSLITPNRKEAFELASLQGERFGVAVDVSIQPGSLRGGGREARTQPADPLCDKNLVRAADCLLSSLMPAILLVTLGDQGMLLCRHGQKPFHIPTVAQEVFDVSGAGDTVIASFTLAIAAGASPVEAAMFSNHAAGVVVGKFGAATVTPEELLASFRRAS